MYLFFLFIILFNCEYFLDKFINIRVFLNLIWLKLYSVRHARVEWWIKRVVLLVSVVVPIKITHSTYVDNFIFQCWLNILGNKFLWLFFYCYPYIGGMRLSISVLAMKKNAESDFFLFFVFGLLTFDPLTVLFYAFFLCTRFLPRVF